MIYADNQGKPDIGANAVEKLIHSDKVQIVLGAYQSSVTLPTTGEAERSKTPYLVQSSVNADITKRGFKYTFRSKQHIEKDTQIMAGFFVDMGDKTGIKAQTVAMCHENSEWGQNKAEIFRKLLPQKGFKIVFEEAYAASASDLTPMLLKVKQSKADVLLLTSYLTDAILISKTVEKQRVDLVAVLNAGGGQNDPTYLSTLGETANYEFALSEWEVGIMEGKPWAKPINAAFKVKYGENFTAAVAEGYSNIWLIKDVMERAKSYDREKIHEAFVKTNYTSGPALIMPYNKKIVFDEQGSNPFADELIGQAYNGTYRIAYPFEFADPTHKAGWPRPKWSERK